jgi:dolichyl-phosphate beta-glucosyltransferase
MPPPQLSIVIPAFNEQRRIVPALKKIRHFLKEEKMEAEILVVNDGSTDDTAAVVREVMPAFGSGVRLEMLENAANRGKGYSVRRGMLESRGRWALFTDSDLSTPIDEYRKLAAPLQAGKAAVAFGSRALPESQIQKRQSWLRESCGRTFNLLVRMLVGLPFKDTQCGFKLFTREAVEAIFPLQTIDGFGFDVEILYIALKLGFRAVEVPVVWNHSEDTRVNLTSGARAFLDILRVRYLDHRGVCDDEGWSRGGLR